MTIEETSLKRAEIVAQILDLFKGAGADILEVMKKLNLAEYNSFTSIHKGIIAADMRLKSAEAPSNKASVPSTVKASVPSTVKASVPSTVKASVPSTVKASVPDKLPSLGALIAYYSKVDMVLRQLQELFVMFSRQKYVSLAIYNSTETRSYNIQKVVTTVGALLAAARDTIVGDDYGSSFPEWLSASGPGPISVELAGLYGRGPSIAPNLFVIWLLRRLITKQEDGELRPEVYDALSSAVDALALTALDASPVGNAAAAAVTTFESMIYLPGLGPVTKSMNKKELLKLIREKIDIRDLKIIEINKRCGLADRSIEFDILPLFESATNINMPITEEIFENTYTIRALAAAPTKDGHSNDDGPRIHLLPWAEVYGGADKKSATVSAKKPIANDKAPVVAKSTNADAATCAVIETLVEGKWRLVGPLSIGAAGHRSSAWLTGADIAAKLLKSNVDRPKINAYNNIINDAFEARATAEATGINFEVMKDLYDNLKVKSDNGGFILDEILAATKAYFARKYGGSADVVPATNTSSKAATVAPSGRVNKAVILREFGSDAINDIVGAVLLRKFTIKNIEYALTILRKNRAIMTIFGREFAEYVTNLQGNTRDNSIDVAEGNFVGYILDGIRAAFAVMDQPPSIWTDYDYSFKEYYMENRGSNV
jgi:hypothetical protein